MRQDIEQESLLWIVAKVVFAFSAILVGAHFAKCFAQEIPAESESESKPLQEAYDELATQFEFRHKDGELLKLNPKPLLNYTNPVRSRGQTGAIYLWTHAGSPVVIGSLWSIRDENDSNSRRLSVELHMLKGGPLGVTKIPSLQGQTRELPKWKPPAELSLEKLNDGVVKQTSTPLLRTASRNIARGFEVEVLDNKTGNGEVLRLMPQAVYEYSDADVLWGGLFAFVLATDPEAFLMLEGRQDGDSAHWYYGFARMTGRGLKAKLDSEIKWKVEKAPLWDGGYPYYFCVHVASLPVEPEQE